MTRLDEREIVDRIRAAFPTRRARLGIGDDAAILDLGPGTVVTSDVLVEGVDFTRGIPLSFVGAKSLAVNVSDLAAMGAVPDSFVATLGAPDWLLSQLDDFIAGLSGASSLYGIELVGGDLSATATAFVSITALGRLESRPLERGDAKPGDGIFVSRPLGGSSAGLSLLGRGWGIDRSGSIAVPDQARPSFEQRAFAESAIRQHVDPLAEWEVGHRLAAIDAVHACIDISDGLSTDLERICRASSTGAVIEWERIPSFDGLDGVGRTLVDPDEATLHGGEEFALLFTADSRESELSAQLGCPVFRIGRMTADAGVIVIERDGIRSALEPRGFDHFRTR